jgi:electron transfer flavoprotein alpha subunit
MLDPAHADPTRKARVIRLPAANPSSRVKWVSGDKSTDEGIHLDAANTIIGVGMGIGGPENLPLVQELCEVLDAHLGATRKVVDSGWLPRQLQIGLTGRSVSPHLYIGLGVRGAFNHTVGIQRSGVVLAINSDPNADLFKQCDYGIVGDWREIIEAMLAVLREARIQRAGEKA